MAEAHLLLEHGLASARREAWQDAYVALTGAQAEVELAGADLEALARSAYMLGRDEEYVAALEAAHQAHLDAGQPHEAARAAFWIGHSLLFRGQVNLAGGWFATSERLVDHSTDCVERGYLMIPRWLQEMAVGDWESGRTTAADAARIADRFADADLAALARDDQARALVMTGRVTEGLHLADELLVIAESGVLSPVVRGIVYCNTIIFCRDAHQVPAARAWTDALTDWCNDRPQMVAHNGLCLVHRAELLQLRGAWDAAKSEAGAAATRFRAGLLNQFAIGHAMYLQGDVQRLRGAWTESEALFREAARLGHDPQPGLALLRLAQGRVPVAAAAIRRAVTENAEPLRRAGLLPAYVDIALAAGDIDAARAALAELARLAVAHRSEVLDARLSHATAAVAIADDDAEFALRSGRDAFRAWTALAAPYEAARSRVLVAVACRALGDDESAMLELEAAQDTFESLGARSDLMVLESRLAGASPGGLSAREREVLRLLARGLSNREIGAELVISEHTVARHLQNIFTKIGVGSRAAAGAYAFEHGLV